MQRKFWDKCIQNHNDPTGLDKDDHEVDAISGATIKGDGVTDMISERLTHYIAYFKNNTPKEEVPTLDETLIEEGLEQATEETTIAYQN